METLVLDGQSLFDIAMQEAGTVEAAFALAVANNIGVSGEVPAGTSLVNVQVINNRMVEYFKIKELKPATYSSIENKEVKMKGVGYTTIGIDFIVSS